MENDTYTDYKNNTWDNEYPSYLSSDNKLHNNTFDVNTTKIIFTKQNESDLVDNDVPIIGVNDNIKLIIDDNGLRGNQNKGKMYV